MKLKPPKIIQAMLGNNFSLHRMILPEDIANACFAFTGGLLSKSAGNILNVDGGVAPAFVR